MAPYAEPTTNKSSFRFGSQLHLLRGLTTTVRPGSFLAVFLGGSLAGGAGAVGLAGGRMDGRGVCVYLLVFMAGSGGWRVLLSFCGQSFLETLQEVPQSIDLG